MPAAVEYEAPTDATETDGVTESDIQHIPGHTLNMTTPVSC